MIISLNSNNKNKYTNQTSFNGRPYFKNSLELVKHGTLQEVQKISWLHGCDKDGKNLLHTAVTTMRTDIIDYLSNKINPNQADIKGITPLHLAIACNNMDIIKLLINKNADINLPDKLGDTPLHKALNNIEIAKYLLDAGANPNVRNCFGIAPLHICYKEAPFLELFKQFNVDFNIKDGACRTILHYAAEENNLQQIKQFISLGLDVNATDEYNQSPIFLTKNPETLDLLFKNSANPNIQDIYGNSVLHKAAQNKDRNLYDLLINYGANKYLKNAKGICAYEYIEKKYIPTTTSGLNKVIGMDELKQTLREMVIEPLTEKKDYEKYALSPANGILLHGLPGCGKTFIANALAEETNRNFYTLSPGDIDSQYYGGATRKIREVFETAKQNSPSIIFIDEMESIAPKRINENSSVAQDNNERIGELLQQMNNIGESNVFVIGATNKPEMIDEAVKRAGRLDRNIFVPPPDEAAREAMFVKMLSNRPREKDINVEMFANKTENYTASEIKNIIDTAAYIAKKEKRNITNDDLFVGLKKVRPAITNAMIERYKKQIGLSEVPEQVISAKNTKQKGFAKIAGMNDLKNILKQDVIEPLSRHSKYQKYGLQPTNGILLYGPPGTGKTFISEALAEESGRNIFFIRPSSVGSIYQNETSLNIKKTFEEAEYNAPSIIFIDEIEALAPKRSNLSPHNNSTEINKDITELLQQINNCADRNIFIIAATNEPQLIDDAIKRVGRFDKTVFVPPPDFEARKALFENALENIYAEDNIDIEKLAQMTENYTAAEIKNAIIRNAAVKALKEDKAISEMDIVEEINKYRPALTKDKIDEYRNKI